MNAASVSRYLAANGARPLPSGTSRMRQGVRVRRSLKAVYVVADYDSTGEAVNVADQVREILSRRYEVSLVSDGTAMYVTERAS